MIRVLVIEDDASQRELTQIILEEEGFSVRTLAGSEHLLSVIKEFDPTIVITDIALPDVDGFSLIKTMHELFPKLPILAYSAHAIPSKFKEFHENAVKLGASDFISKPYDIRDFVANVRRLV